MLQKGKCNNNKAKMTKSIENKKIKAKNTNTIIKIKNNKDYYNVHIEFDSLIEPYMRNRMRVITSKKTKQFVSAHLFDPLNTYKNIIQTSLLKELNNIKNFQPVKGQIELKIVVFKKIPKGFSNKKKLYAVQKKIQPITKPDGDNIEKTIMDIFNKVLWLDDSQVCKMNFEKYYDLKESTIIDMKLFKEELKINGRMNKEEDKQWKEILIQQNI